MEAGLAATCDAVIAEDVFGRLVIRDPRDVFLCQLDAEVALQPSDQGDVADRAPPPGLPVAEATERILGALPQCRSKADLEYFQVLFRLRVVHIIHKGWRWRVISGRRLRLQ